MDGVAQAVAPEVARVRLVTGQVAAMERRVREIDALLGTEELDLTAARDTLQRIAARGGVACWHGACEAGRMLATDEVPTAATLTSPGVDR